MPSRRGFLIAAGAAGLLAADSPLTVGQVVERIQKNLGVPWRTPTVDTLKAGTPDTPVQGIATTMMATFDVLRRVAINPGYADLQGAMRTLARPDIDVLVIGEAREWEGIAYVQDSIAAGKPKGLIVLGHVISEENGMNECARWLKTFITEVPVEFIAAGEPFWSPQA